MEERGAVTGKAKASGRFLVQVSTMKDIGLQALAKYDLESESKSDDDLVVGGTGRLLGSRRCTFSGISVLGSPIGLRSQFCEGSILEGLSEQIARYNSSNYSSAMEFFSRR